MGGSGGHQSGGSGDKGGYASQARSKHHNPLLTWQGRGKG